MNAELNYKIERGISKPASMIIEYLKCKADLNFSSLKLILDRRYVRLRPGGISFHLKIDHFHPLPVYNFSAHSSNMPLKKALSLPFKIYY